MNTREPYTVFEPDSPADEQTAIILVNHLGSSRHEDAGRDADYLAQRFGAIAIALDRPATGLIPGNSELRMALSQNPVSVMAQHVSKLDNTLESYGIKNTIITGRSAGGLGALELARTGLVSSTKLVYAAEPIGCYDISAADGERRFRSYAAIESKMQHAAVQGRTDLIVPDKYDNSLDPLNRLRRLATMVPLFLADRHYNRQHWNQAHVPKHLGALASQGTVTRIDFAEHSLVLPTDKADRDTLMQSLSTITTNSEVTVEVRTIQHTSHASFDSRGFFSQRLEDARQNDD